MTKISIFYIRWKKNIAELSIYKHLSHRSQSVMISSTLLLADRHTIGRAVDYHRVERSFAAHPRRAHDCLPSPGILLYLRL